MNKTVYAVWKQSYKYYCNWCKQNTNSLHYRCATHYADQTCATSAKTCTVEEKSGACGGKMTINSNYNNSQVAGVCNNCSSKIYYYYISCIKCGFTATTSTCSNSACMNSRLSKGWTCGNKVTTKCNKTYTTNYKTY